MRSCTSCGAPCLEGHRFCPSCGAELPRPRRARQSSDRLEGAVLGGKFVLRELIGTGGMGKVFRAEQKGVGRSVAVKIMHSHLLGDRTAAARFINEAKAASQLNHPHIIAVLDFGQTESGSFYTVMEYLRGRSLDHLVQHEFPIPLGRVASVLCQTMEAVEAAHRYNIIHRDLKPENIFLLEDGAGRDFVKVLDFGIAKMLDPEVDKGVTRPGLVPGTPEYMSPEQARGEELDPRSDVYSLGVILYEMLTGHVPFKGASAVATMMAHVQDPPLPPSARRPDRGIPESLDTITLWALAKDPADRIASSGHFRDLLAAWARVAGLWPDESGEIDPAASQELLYESVEVLRDVFSDDQVQTLPVEASPGRPEVAPPPPRPATEPTSMLLLPLAPLDIVGRERELERLRGLLTGRGPAALRIEGDRGMGKARLMTETFKLAQKAGSDVFRCKPDPGWVPRILGAAQRAALHCLGLSRGGLSPTSENILQSAAALGLGEEHVAGLKELFGLPTPLAAAEPGHRARERSAAFCHLAHRAASRRAMVMIFEEAQRYDQPSRELIATLAMSAKGPLKVIVTNTPEGGQRWPSGLASMTLPPLDRHASRQLVQGLFAGAAVDPALVERICDVAGGQPLFIEQLAHALEVGRIQDPPDRLPDLVAGEFERLPQRQREILQWMAALHEAASCDLLGELLGDQVASDDLLPLVYKGLCTVTTRGYAFVHNLVAMVVYSSIPAEVRREIHHRVAAVLHNRDGASDNVAYHAYEADDGPRALEMLEAAGERASRFLDDEGAIRHYTRALELVRREWGRGRMDAEELDRIAVAIGRRLADVLARTGERLAAMGVLEEILSVAAGHAAARGWVRLDLGRLDFDRGQPQQALRRLELAQRDADSSGSDALLADVDRELARVAGALGDVERALGLLDAALAAATRAGGNGAGGVRWKALHAAGSVASDLGAHDAARAHLERALEVAAGEGPEARLATLGALGRLHIRRRAWLEAEQRLAEALDVAVQMGDRTARAELLLDLAQIQRLAGDTDRARALVADASRLSRRIGWGRGIRRASEEMELLSYEALARTPAGAGGAAGETGGGRARPGAWWAGGRPS